MTVSTERTSSPVSRQPFALVPVVGAAAAVVVVLAIVSNRYGYHRDELYFRILRPGWGYIDQPPLTPLLARATKELIADQVWALRIPAILSAAVAVVLSAAIAREVGGGRLAQTLAAWGYGFGTFPLILGHVLLTTSVDAPVWLAVLLLIIRACLRAEARAWLWAGVVVGLGLYNKLLIVLLLAALAIGLLLVGPRRLLISPPVWLAMGLALLVGLPNVIYQIVNGWPQLEFGRQLAAHNSGDVRANMWPLLFLLLGPPLTLVWAAGIVALCKRPQWRAIRFVAAAFPALVLFVFVLGSQPYYEFALLAALFAIGCVPAAEWMAHGRRWRSPVVVVLGVINAIIGGLIALPLVPVDDLGSTPIPGINQTARDTVGWPRYVAQVAAAYRSVPANLRSRTAIVASNYGEDGAIDRYGPALGLPPPYSAQNQLYYQRRPSRVMDRAVIVGGEADYARTLFAACRSAGHLDNDVGVDNEEQGEPIIVCRDPRGGWRAVWPALKHED